MTRNRRQVARLLGYAGLIPFLALAAIAYTGAPQWAERLLVGYAMAILSFLAGTLWSGALGGDAERSEPVVVSNVLVLAALPALVLPLAWTAPWLAVLFVLHFVAERRWLASGQPGWYRRLRLTLSSVAVLALFAAGAGALSGGAA